MDAVGRVLESEFGLVAACRVPDEKRDHAAVPHRFGSGGGAVTAVNASPTPGFV